MTTLQQQPINALREVTEIHSGIATSDGDGVKLTRIIGTTKLDMLDPFLLLDCFESDDAADYIGGFPTHPHRGFETVTYLLNGKMRHKDSAGHEGVVEPGGVQWMTAGKGVLHSEMPEQDNGLLKGYQLWVNLPKSAKMIEPSYQEYPPEITPLETRADGSVVRVIAGKTDLGTQGPIVNPYTKPTFMDVSLAKHQEFEQRLPLQHNAFLYVIDGEALVYDHTGKTTAVSAKQVALLSPGERLLVSATDNARFLLLAGQPLNEPVERAGPFVMNTRQELLQAYHDFQSGHFN
ncbi:pirin family protein [Paraferrimonas haliotis]|uniref:pirin family protein n=1 Tax=Paraferrimonas haliotis TaxID=2013866 RepID=UPI000BA9907C|nr:pirin family protein [Paraferrimonas haliotis]